MFASNAIMYFIIMTTAATLHAHGQTNIATAQEAAEALRPLAGAGAYWLFTLGLIGTGMLGGAGARGIVRVRDRRGRRLARVAESTAAAARRSSTSCSPWRWRSASALNYAGLNAIKLLFTTAVINGVLAPPLILIVLLLTRDRTVMGDAVNSPLVTSWAGPHSS